MAAGTQRMTVAEFDEFVEQPENADRLFEYIGGEVVEVPSNPHVSNVASRISGFMFIYLLQNDIGRLTGEAGGFIVSGERYAPDEAFTLKEKSLARQGYNPEAPDLVVEVISLSDDLNKLRIKISNYLAAGVVVWIIDPNRELVEIHQAGKSAQIARHGDSLDGGELLPGFTLAVDDIFPDEEA